jgi:hypothetical protein
LGSEDRKNRQKIEKDLSKLILFWNAKIARINKKSKENLYNLNNFIAYNFNFIVNRSQQKSTRKKQEITRNKFWK